MNRNRISMTVGLLILLFIMPTCGFASSKQQFCNSYADTAVKQYNLGMQHNLPGIIPPAWSNDRNGHFNWCMTVLKNFANSEQGKRQAYLDKNIPKEDSGNQVFTGTIIGTATELPDMSNLIGMSEKICAHYADESVRQNKRNIFLNCGFKPPSWSADYNAHKSWCLHGSNYLQADKHLVARKKQLVTCNGSDLIWIQGMVLGLRHASNMWEDPFLPATKYFEARGITFIKKLIVDEIGTPLIGDRYTPITVTYLTVAKGLYNGATKYKLPTGIVIGLGYRCARKGNFSRSIGNPVFGVSASIRGPEYLPGGTFKKYCGGDLAANAGDGWCWYESTGIGFSSWPDVNKLPRGTVIGLKHNRNQPNKKLIWQKTVFDPADPNIAPPPGFARKVGGDRGAPSGIGYFWYEKITGE